LTPGKRVLELGAGGALPSIACALAGADVVATDYADASLVSNIAFNASANGADLAAVGHTWGTDIAPVLAAGRKQGEFDLVILSDLMFNHSQHDALILTLERTLKPGSGSASTPAEFASVLQNSTVNVDDAAAAASASASPSIPCALVFLTHHRPRLSDADMAFFPRLAARGWAYERVTQSYTGPMFENDPGDARVRGTVHGFRCWRL
jgi:nicotinamide N-methyltransferase